MRPVAYLPTSRLVAVAERAYSSGPLFMRKAQQFRPRICPFDLMLPHVRPGAEILDVGCGSGLFLMLAASIIPGVRGVGFDPSHAAIRTAAAAASRLDEHAKGRLRFEKCSASDPWPEGEFDVVALIDVLHHIPAREQETVFRQACRHVKPGGMLLYKDMSTRSRRWSTLNRLHDLVLARQWIRYVAVASVLDWARDVQFELRHRDAALRFGYDHDLLVFERPASDQK